MKFNRSVYQSLAMIGQFGINILVPVLFCSFLGMLIDKKFGTSCFVIILFFVGAAAGFRNVYRFSRRIFEDKNSNSPYLHKGRYGEGESRSGESDDGSFDSKGK